ncbi:MAG: hypothetical protein NZ571_15890, partial [Anaerolineae bacterium]|nr:hypothetical protein [Anaerolineae bacterium]
KQASNWMVGFQNVYFAFLLCITLIVVLIEVLPIGWRALWLSALIALFGSVALGAAPFFWILPLVALWLRGYRRWQYYAVWLTLTALLTAYFVSGLTAPLSPPPPLDRLGLVAHFAVAFLGAPIAPIPRLLIGTALSLFGLLLFALNSLVLRQWRPEWLRSWVALAAFSALSAIMAAYGRWIFFDGVSAYPLTDRYVTNGVPFWIALLVIMTSTMFLRRRGARLELEKLPRYLVPLADWLQRNLYRINSLSLAGLGIVFLVSLVVAQVRLPNDKPIGECLRTLPITRDFDCARDLAAGRSNFLPVLVRADQLAVRRLGIFAREPAVEPRFGEVAVPLEYIGTGTPSPSSFDGRFVTHEINGEMHRVFRQRSPAAHDWTVWFQHITAPTHFESALYVPPTEQVSQAVTFRVYGQFFLSKERQLLLEQRFDPRQQREPVPIRVSLAPFLNQVGRLMLILETEGNAAQAMWIEPRFVLELTEEAARAKYYPPQ